MTHTHPSGQASKSPSRRTRARRGASPGHRTSDRVPVCNPVDKEEEASEEEVGKSVSLMSLVGGDKELYDAALACFLSPLDPPEIFEWRTIGIRRFLTRDAACGVNPPVEMNGGVNYGGASDANIDQFKRDFVQWVIGALGGGIAIGGCGVGCNEHELNLIVGHLIAFQFTPWCQAVEAVGGIGIGTLATVRRVTNKSGANVPLNIPVTTFFTSTNRTQVNRSRQKHSDLI